MKKQFQICGLTALAAVCALFIGCGKESEITGPSPVNGRFAGETVLVKFNDHKLRFRDICDYSKLRVAVYKTMKPNAPSEELKKVFSATSAMCLANFLQNSIIIDESARYKKSRGDYKEQDRQAVTQWLETQYLNQDGASRHNFKALRNIMRKEGVLKQFDEQINNEIETELYFRVACSNRYRIAEYVISNVYAKYQINNYFASNTNRAIVAMASNVLNKVKSGEDFHDLADRYTMLPEENSGGNMGVCSAADFPGEEEIWEAVKGLDEGETTDIIDAGDSWQILKVIKRDDSNLQDPSLHLARIYFRNAWVIDRPSRKEVIEALEDDRRQRLLREVLNARLPGSKIEFPRGKKVFIDLRPAKPYLDVIEGISTNLVVETELVKP